LRQGIYQPSKPLKVRIPNKLNSNKNMIIDVSNIRDRIVEYAIRIVLTSFYEKEFILLPRTFWLVKGENQFSHILRMLKSKGYIWYLGADVKSFYSSINISLLIKELITKTEDKALVNLIKKCLFIEFKDKGLPTGHILSTFLANIYLYPIDIQLIEKIAVRFSDSWFFAKKKNENFHSDIEFLDKLLRKRNLSLNREKMRIYFNPTPEALLLNL